MASYFFVFANQFLICQDAQQQNGSVSFALYNGFANEDNHSYSDMQIKAFLSDLHYSKSFFFCLFFKTYSKEFPIGLTSVISLFLQQIKTHPVGKRFFGEPLPTWLVPGSVQPLYSLKGFIYCGAGVGTVVS